MKLYATEACLSETRYHLVLSEWAQMLISETGYHLRDKALAELKQHL